MDDHDEHEPLLKRAGSNDIFLVGGPNSDGLVARLPAWQLPTHVTPLSDAAFEAIVQDVADAIAQGIHPVRIAQGSSGSYFCRNTKGEIVGVFKPKSEEPYGHLNPKLSKWIQRNCFPCCFGRSCLLPNQGYLSEAAASYLDRRLGLGVVPRTDIVKLASPAFFYPFQVRWAYSLWKKPLPLKTGSFQIFLRGYKDATTFFRMGYEKIRASASTRSTPAPDASASNHPFGWTLEQQQAFQLGFERLVILDYLIRNTDRGSDNWMVKWENDSDTIDDGNAAEACVIHATPGPSSNSLVIKAQGSDASGVDRQYVAGTESQDQQVDLFADVIDPSNQLATSDEEGLYIEQIPPSPALQQSQQHKQEIPCAIQIAAIDNGLAFPIHHPNRIRSYPYGWSFLPIAHAPFAPATANLVLPSLTSPSWWDETLHGLETLFKIDPHFNQKMWRKQRGVVRGQGYTLVDLLGKVVNLSGSPTDEADRLANATPFNLVRRPVIIVHEEEVEDDEDEEQGDDDTGVYDALHASTLHHHHESHQHGSYPTVSPPRAVDPMSASWSEAQNSQSASGPIKRSPSFMQRQRRKLKKVKRRLETLTLRPCCHLW